MNSYWDRGRLARAQAMLSQEQRLMLIVHNLHSTKAGAGGPSNRLEFLTALASCRLKDHTTC